MKICFRCNTNKEISEYYKHKGNKDGYLNKCKTCTKEDSIKNHHRKSKDPDWVEKERARGREKYKRLNYKERGYELNKNKPWTKNHKYKNLSRKIKTKKGIERHHWNYNDDYLEDVFLMPIKDHRRLHQLIELDYDKLIFKTKSDGKYLFSKLDHMSFIVENKFNYSLPF